MKNVVSLHVTKIPYVILNTLTGKFYMQTYRLCIPIWMCTLCILCVCWVHNRISIDTSVPFELAPEQRGTFWRPEFVCASNRYVCFCVYSYVMSACWDVCVFVCTIGRLIWNQAKMFPLLYICSVFATATYKYIMYTLFACIHM